MKKIVVSLALLIFYINPAFSLSKETKAMFFKSCYESSEKTEPYKIYCNCVAGALDQEYSDEQYGAILVETKGQINKVPEIVGFMKACNYLANQ